MYFIIGIELYMKLGVFVKCTIDLLKFIIPSECVFNITRSVRMKSNWQKLYLSISAMTVTVSYKSTNLMTFLGCFQQFCKI